MAKTFKLKQAAWFKDEEREFTVPDSFTVDLITPKDAPSLTPDEILGSIQKPFGPSLREMAIGKKKVVVVTDDLGRPTPAYLLIPILIEELETAGILKENISFVIATGSHRQLSCSEIEKKIGKTIADSYPVHCHDAFNSPMVHLGRLDNGFPCIANRQVAEADLILGIGCVIPHACHGFGGGAKLFCPGIAGMESIVTMHGFVPKRGRVITDPPPGVWDMRSASEAFARLLPPIFLVNAVVNSQREIAGLFAGETDPVFRAAQERALEIYKTEIDPEKAASYDVILVNMYPLDSDPVQSGKSPWIRQYFKHALPIQINSSADGIDYHGWKLLRKSRWSTFLILLTGEALSLKFMPVFLRRPASWKIIKTLRSYCLKRMLDHPGVDYDTFIKNQHTLTQRTEDYTDDSKIPSLFRKPWIFSENYPPLQFKKKYPFGSLLRNWDHVIQSIQSHFPKPKIAVVTCAAMQIPVYSNSQNEPNAL